MRIDRSASIHAESIFPNNILLHLFIVSSLNLIILVPDELKDVFTATKPKLIFCQSDKVQESEKAKELAGADGKVISYDNSPDAISFSDMMGRYGEDSNVQDYK